MPSPYDKNGSIEKIVPAERTVTQIPLTHGAAYPLKRLCSEVPHHEPKHFFFYFRKI
jgi:hypothetical protein